MGSLTGTFYGAYAENQIYLIINTSDDNSGLISGTLLNYGNMGDVKGKYYINTTSATLMLTVTPRSGGADEQWQLITYDYNVLSGTRTYIGPVGGGFVIESIAGLGRR